jgi:hypothetical protein
MDTLPGCVAIVPILIGHDGLRKQKAGLPG